jgi:hypothetical protein
VNQGAGERFVVFNADDFGYSNGINGGTNRSPPRRRDQREPDDHRS